MSESRTARTTRKTLETDVSVHIMLDGTGVAAVDTGVGFFDHLLTSLAHHALVDLELTVAGDLAVDDHHTVEDASLTLGDAFGQALGDRAGLTRFGSASVPMDEALATCALDVGGRPHAVVDLALVTPYIGNLTTQNLPHALESLAQNAGWTIHLHSAGQNDHHVAEAAFKALAVALRQAIAIDDRRMGVASTKGVVT